jgi:glucose-1-phosphate thymidylyltransferase
MKALVLSGGRGTRLRPFSHTMAKQLIPVGGKPVLQYVIENIRDIGVTDIGVIVGDRAAEISQAIGDGSRFGVRVSYIRQDEPLGLAHCVAIARPFLSDDDFVMYLGDNMLPEGIVAEAEEFAAQRPNAQVLVSKVADPRAFGVVEAGPDGRVHRLAEKPAHPRSDLAAVGVYFFTAAIHDAVAAIAASARGELEITDAIQWLLDHGADVRASRYQGYWKDTGVPEDVLDCNRHVLATLRSELAGDLDEISELYGPVVVATGARVERSRIIGPAIIGPGAVIRDSFVGPDTSIGGGCTLNRAGVADSIVMDGATISGVPDLRGCLIGRSATVGAVRPKQAHHQLLVGDHTSVKLATRNRRLLLVPQALVERAS